ncbi:hypothetical protein J4462_03605 [Candidatus Pacearchaeota archaeon]|nr:hypothetical protein [Candidatus Pacearchaeota archaeon]
MVDRLVEHIRNLYSSELGKSREPEAYLFYGHDIGRVVDDKNRIFLPIDIISKVMARNRDYGHGEVNPRAVFMTSCNPLVPVIYLCYSPSRILQIDDSNMSKGDYDLLMLFYSITSEEIIAPNRKLTLPKGLRGARKVVVRPDKEVFILESVE